MPNPTQDVVTVQASPSTVDAWWAIEADEVEGYDLLKDEALLELVGVPFLGFTVTFRDGVQRKGIDYRDDYASLEVRVAPEAVWNAQLQRILTRRRSFELDSNAPVAQPGEQLVVNDGSTGIYRQITEYLEAKGLIELPEGPTQGEKGESRFDAPRSLWMAGGDEAEFKIALRCSRGLRFSDYENEYGKARTWYIA